MGYFEALLACEVLEKRRRAGELALVDLDRGEIPPWLVRSDERAFGALTAVIRAIRNIVTVPPGARDVLDIIIQDIGATPINRVIYAWAEAWIKAIKVERTAEMAEKPHVIAAAVHVSARSPSGSFSQERFRRTQCQAHR
jgi:hypothetical protein